MGSMENRTILITGAAGGLGSELAALCAAAACNTVMLDSDKTGLESGYDSIVDRGLKEPFLYPMDLAAATPAQIEELVGALSSEFGGLDCLVHCAARFDGLRPLDQLRPSEWLRQLEVNLSAPWLLSARCMPLLQASSAAHLFFLLEDMDRMAGAFWGAYGVSKAALKALVSQFAAEFSRAGIQVLGINPGPMRTPLRAAAYHGENPALQPEPAVAAGRIFDLLAGETIPEAEFIDFDQPQNRSSPVL